MTHTNDITLARVYGKIKYILLCRKVLQNTARKGKNLSYAERVQIAVLKKEDYSNRRIADVIGQVPHTFNNEIHRGGITQIKRQKQNGKIYDYYIKVYDADAVLLTLAERQTRFEIILKVNGKDQESVNQTIRGLQKRSSDTFFTLFKTITSDNGSEFAGLYEALKDTLDIYFSHPYASFERGTSENQHKFIRRFIPKGKLMGRVSEAHCLRIQQWMNDYPRKILDYRTPHECFVNALQSERQAA